MSSRLMSAEKGRGKHAEQAGECGRVCALAGSLRAACGRTDGVCAIAGSRHADYGHGGFKLRWRGRNCRLWLRSGLRILAAHGNVGAFPGNGIVAQALLSVSRRSARLHPPGNAHSRGFQPLLVVPDVPPACFRHRRRQASVPQAAAGSGPSGRF